LTTRIRKSAEARKIEIIEAALRLAGDIGPDRMTTDALAKEVGISQPGIFRHFPTKVDIWDAVAQHIGKLLRANATTSQNEDQLPIAKLTGLVVGQLMFIKSTPAIPAILFSRELHAENDKLRAFFAGLIAQRQRLFSKLIAAEIEAGRFDKSLDPDDAAYLILALIQGLAMRWSLNARNFDLEDEGLRLLELQLDGFKRKGRLMTTPPKTNRSTSKVKRKSGN